MFLQNKRIACSAAVVVLTYLACNLLATRADDSATALPRYKFKIGQQLNYEGKSEFKYDTGAFVDIDHWQIAVVGRNDDGSHRMVVRYNRTTKRTQADGKEFSEPEKIYNASADIDPTGKITERLNSFGSRIVPESSPARRPSSHKGGNPRALSTAPSIFATLACVAVTATFHYQETTPSLRVQTS